MNFHKDFRINAGPWAHEDTGYSDIPWCIELGALYDDTLKKDDFFCNYAVAVAQKIADQRPGKKVKITWGKWGARIEETPNKKHTREQLKEVANFIVKHPCWMSLMTSTHVFTYGK